jgi:hypothetical protein
MKKKRKYKILMIFALCISFSCALYLNGQLQGQGLDMVPTSASFTAIASDQNIDFPDVEVLKIVVEKFIDLITLASA